MYVGAITVIPPYQRRAHAVKLLVTCVEKRMSLSLPIIKRNTCNKYVHRNFNTAAAIAILSRSTQSPFTACILRFPLAIPPIYSFPPFPPSHSTHLRPTLQSTASARHLCLRWSHVHRVRTHNCRHAAINTEQCARRTALGCDVGDAQWVVWDCVS